MEKVSWTERKTNKEVLEMVEESKLLGETSNMQKKWMEGSGR